MNKKTFTALFLLWICTLFFIPLPVFSQGGDIRSSSHIPDLQLQIPIDRITNAGSKQLQSSGTTPDPNIRLPVEKLAGISGAELSKWSGIGTYIAVISTWLIGAISLLAVIAFMVGGVIWLTAAGSTQRVTFAKKIITDTFGALVVTLGIYLILSIFNKDLVELRITPPGGIQSIQHATGTSSP
jgi:hypothetical protein